MSPKKEITVEDVVETDIRNWQEERADVGSSVEPEQLDFDED